MSSEFLVPYVQVRLRPSDGRAPAYCDSPPGKVLRLFQSQLG